MLQVKLRAKDQVDTTVCWPKGRPDGQDLSMLRTELLGCHLVFHKGLGFMVYLVFHMGLVWFWDDLLGLGYSRV